MANLGQGVRATRTFALAGHRSSGKTSIGDLLLYATGATRTLGRVSDGTSLLDHDAEARRRGMTLRLGFAWMEWEGHRLEMVDTPGSEGLAHEQALALSCVDSALIVIAATDGVQLGTRRVLDEAARAGLPRVVVVSRMDRASDPRGVVAQLEETVTGTRVVPLQLPLYEEGRFAGVIDVLGRRALRYAPDASGAFSEEPVPAGMQAELAAATDRIVDAVALSDDTLLERYLEDLELPLHLVRQGLARAIAAGKLLPVVYASAVAAIGAQPLLDLVAWALPSPEDRRGPWALDATGDDVEIRPEGPFVAQLLATRLDEEGQRFHVLRVWSGKPPRKGGWVHGETGQIAKVQKLYALRGPRAAQAKHEGAGAIVATWDPLTGRPGDTWTDGPRLVLGAPPQPPPMLAVRVVPASKKDFEALPAALATLGDLDPALEIAADEVTGDPLVAGVGQEHLERALDVLRGRLGVAFTTEPPAVPYRETPAVAVRSVHAVHKKSSDGEVSEYAACTVDLTPTPVDQPLRYEHAADEDKLPVKYEDALVAGVRDGLRSGPTAGYPVIGVEVRCTDGDYDILQTTDDHVRAAAEKAVRAALEKAGTRLLEPWWSVHVVVPSDDVGQVLADLGARRARIQGLEVDGRQASVFADCPYRELRAFGPRLQALTAGRGRFTAHASHYDVLPAHLVKEAVAASPFRMG
jgi:elongation factor G